MLCSTCVLCRLYSLVIRRSVKHGAGRWPTLSPTVSSTNVFAAHANQMVLSTKCIYRQMYYICNKSVFFPPPDPPLFPPAKGAKALVHYQIRVAGGCQPNMVLFIVGVALQ